MQFDDPHADLLGMCLADRKALELAITRGLTPDAFPDADERTIFEALLGAEAKGKPTSAAAIAAGLPALREKVKLLRANAHVGLNADYFLDEVLARMWHQEAALRLNDLQRLLATRKPFDDVAPAKAALRESLDRLLSGVDGSKVGPKEIGAVLASELDKIERDILNHEAGKMPGIPSGITALDKLTSGGFKKGTVNVIAARTGMGKTTLALNFALHAAVNKFEVCYFTVEMPAGQLARKLISLVSAIQTAKVVGGDLNEAERDRLAAAIRDLERRPFWIDDSFKASFEAFEMSCRKLKRQGALDLVVVDYIQQLTLAGRHHSKQALVTEVSSRLKQLAIELDIAVISLAQFNREAEKEGGEPSIWQVKDSGAIEQDADLGVCLFKDELDNFWLKVDKNRWGRDRIKFLVSADLSVASFSNASINLPGDF